MGSVDTSIANEEFWSSVGYWILVAGLVGDIIVLVVPKHRERLEKVLAAFFTIVIIVGVAIEHRADAAISVLVSQGQQASSLQIAQLNTEAGDARRIAGEAEERGGKAISDAGKANERAGEANERAAKNEKEAVTLRKAAEDERLARLKIEVRLAPRRVAGEQAKQLCSALHVTGRPTLDIMSSFGTPEADDFAEDIAKALAGCGFAVTLGKSVMIFPVPKPLRVGFAPNREYDAESIDTAMFKAGIATKAIERVPVPDAGQNPNALRLFVGPKSD